MRVEIAFWGVGIVEKVLEHGILVIMGAKAIFPLKINPNPAYRDPQHLLLRPLQQNPPFQFAMAETQTSSFPFDLLPLDLQSRILSLLPISTLLRCSAASRHLRRLLRRPSFISCYPKSSQPLFLFSDELSPAAAAYDPLLDRWLSLPLAPSTLPIDSPSGHLLLSKPSDDQLSVSSPFSSSPPIPIPATAPGFYYVALIPSGDRDFKILSIDGCRDRIRSKIFDSVTGKWAVAGDLVRAFTLVSCSAILDGVLFCLTYGPYSILTFDLVGGDWAYLVKNLPADCLQQVLVFDGRLFLVGGVEEAARGVVRVGIWEMNWEKMEWVVYCFMPEEDFGRLSEWVNRFRSVSCKGIVCFVGAKSDEVNLILMCDLAKKRWWWPSGQEERMAGMGNYCSVHTVEPYIGLVKGNI